MLQKEAVMVMNLTFRRRQEAEKNAMSEQDMNGLKIIMLTKIDCLRFFFLAFLGIWLAILLMFIVCYDSLLYIG